MGPNGRRIVNRLHRKPRDLCVVIIIIIIIIITITIITVIII
jgi:hypothetical protein